MRKAFPLFGVVVFLSTSFCSCATGVRDPASPLLSMSEQWASGYFIANSHDGAIVVIGVANRQAARWGNEILPAEIELARDDAARKIAMFYGLGGTVESFHRQGAGFFDFIAESRLDLRSVVADHSQFIERLTFDPARDVLVHDRGTLVRFRYGGGIPAANFAGSLNADGRPNWINNQNFNIDGYVAAVGFSPNRVWLNDTVIRATEAAAARLIKGLDTRITTSVVDAQGQGTLTYIASYSSGVLNGFRIIEFWIDPANMSVYALGIARR